MKDDLKLDVSVCVVTRHRPEPLRRLLEALAACTPPDDLRWVETVVVDNDHERSAETTVNDASDAFPVALRYVVEPTAGVSAARNAAMASSSGRFVAFIDDDMTPDAAWLHALAKGVIHHEAQAAIGPVDILFETDPPVGLEESGALDFPNWEPGSTIDTLRTGNAILDREALAPQPFDDRFAASGGEDHLLGRQITAAGGKIVFLAEAIAGEWTTAERLSPVALNARQRRLGFAYTHVDISLATGPKAIATRLNHIATGIARICVGCALAAPWLPAARRWRAHRLRWFGVGQLSAAAGSSMEYY